MTDKQRIEYLGTALRIANIHIDDRTCDLVIRVYQKIEERKGDTDLMDISRIKAAIERDYEKKDKKTLK